VTLFLEFYLSSVTVLSLLSLLSRPSLFSSHWKRQLVTSLSFIKTVVNLLFNSERPQVRIVHVTCTQYVLPFRKNRFKYIPHLIRCTASCRALHSIPGRELGILLKLFTLSERLPSAPFSCPVGSGGIGYSLY
jgi:hypothetical protein